MSGKTPTRDEKKYINNAGLDARDYLVLKRFNDYIEVKHRRTGEVRKVQK